MTRKQTGKKFTQTLTLNLFGAVCMAVVVHALLLFVLSIEMRWTEENTPITVEAELWSTLPLDTDFQQTEQAAPRTGASIPLDFSVLPPSQQVSPSIVVEQEIDQSDNAKQLLQDQKEQKRRKSEASRLQMLEDEQQSREESVRDPT